MNCFIHLHHVLGIISSSMQQSGLHKHLNVHKPQILQSKRKAGLVELIMAFSFFSLHPWLSTICALQTIWQIHFWML